MGPELEKQLTLQRWRAAKEPERTKLATLVVDASAGALKVVRKAGEDEVPVFLHEPTQILFHLVPGGTCRLGFSKAEADEVFRQYRGWEEAESTDRMIEDRDALPPAFSAEVKPFLLAARPLDRAQMDYLRAADDAAREQVRSAGRKVWRYEEVARLPADKYVQYLESNSDGSLRQVDIDGAEKLLQSRGLRLPTDDEWEAAARAGGETPFPTGRTIPEDPNVGVNRFGFVDMGAWSEVVSGFWTAPRRGIPGAGHVEAQRVGSGEGGEAPLRRARGGAAMVYPWQACSEWTLLLCACRTTAKELDGLLALRPVLEI